MPPAACTSGSTITAVSSRACAATVRSSSRVDSSSCGSGTTSCFGSEAAEQPVHARPRDRRPTSRRTCRRDSRRESSRSASAPARRGSSDTGAPSSSRPRRTPSPTRVKNTCSRSPGNNAASRAANEVGGRVHEAAEHHVRHALELRGDRGADVRMVVAVAGGPPRRDAVDELAAVGEIQPHAVGALDDERRRRRFHLPIRQPEMTQRCHTDS